MKLFLKVSYFFFLVLILGFWLSKNNFSVIAFGRLFGLLAVYSVLMQLMLIGRIKWIESHFGHDKLARHHRANGKMAYFFVLLHFGFVTVGYATVFKNNIFQQIADFWSNYPELNKAIIALIILTTTVFLSIFFSKIKIKYETWYYIHLFNYLAILLAFSHQLELGTDIAGDNVMTLLWWGVYTFVFGNLIFFRLLKPIYNFWKFRFTVSEIKKENGNATSVYITGKSLGDFKVIPGQFLIVKFLHKNFWFESHPFSMSKYPDGESLRLTIKNVGDFTSTIPQIPVGTKVLIDGPHGIFTPQIAKKEKFLLIAGGIGITPIRSMLEDLLLKKKDVVVIYSCKTKEDVVLDRELEALQKIYKFKIKYLYTEESGKHVDAEMIKAEVADFAEREIYICGPVGMMQAISDSVVQNLGVAKEQIHTEKFAF